MYGTHAEHWGSAMTESEFLRQLEIQMGLINRHTEIVGELVRDRQMQHLARMDHADKCGQEREHAGAVRPSQAVSEERAECCGGGEENQCGAPKYPISLDDLVAEILEGDNAVRVDPSWCGMCGMTIPLEPRTTHHTVTYHGFPVSFTIVEL